MRTPLLLLASLLAAAPAPAQDVGGEWLRRHRICGFFFEQRYGLPVVGLGDVDLDGYPDFGIGAVGESVLGQKDAGAAYVYSGLDGVLLWSFAGANANDYFSFATAGAGDVDGDGYPDIVIGAYGEDFPGQPGAGGVHVYSGLTGQEIFALRGLDSLDVFGYAVDGAGDVNNDGFGDLVVGALLADSPDDPLLLDIGAVILFSGFDGAEIRRFHGEAFEDFFGHAVAGAGDVDGDGRPDQLLGVPRADPGALLDAGVAHLVSGRDGSVIRTYEGAASSDFFGHAVANAGDVDADGVPDQVIGAWATDPGGLSNAGSVYVYSGASGALIHQFDGDSANGQLGTSVNGAGDVDGDGFDEVIFGAHFQDPGGVANAGSAYVMSGIDGRVLWRLDGAAANDNLGVSADGVGDLDLDGRAEVIVGADLEDNVSTSDAGCAYVYGLEKTFFELDGFELSASGGAPVEATLDFPQGESGYSYIVLASLQGTGPTSLGGAQIPLTRDSLFDLVLSGQAPPAMEGVYGVLDNNGDGSARLVSHPILAGVVDELVYLAAVSYDPSLLAARLVSIPRAIQIVP